MFREFQKYTIRDRLHLLHELSQTGSYEWESICGHAVTLDVMTAISGLDKETGPKFIRVGGSVSSLTGYTAAELTGVNPNILQCSETNTATLPRLMLDISTTGKGEIKIVNQRKSGELYGCHILASKSVFDPDHHEYFMAFLGECPLDEC